MPPELMLIAGIGCLIIGAIALVSGVSKLSDSQQVLAAAEERNRTAAMKSVLMSESYDRMRRLNNEVHWLINEIEEVRLTPNLRARFQMLKALNERNLKSQPLEEPKQLVDIHYKLSESRPRPPAPPPPPHGQRTRPEPVRKQRESRPVEQTQQSGGFDLPTALVVASMLENPLPHHTPESAHDSVMRMSDPSYATNPTPDPTPAIEHHSSPSVDISPSDFTSPTNDSYSSPSTDVSDHSSFDSGGFSSGGFDSGSSGGGFDSGGGF